MARRCHGGEDHQGFITPRMATLDFSLGRSCGHSPLVLPLWILRPRSFCRTRGTTSSGRREIPEVVFPVRTLRALADAGSSDRSLRPPSRRWATYRAATVSSSGWSPRRSIGSVPRRSTSRSSSPPDRSASSRSGCSSGVSTRRASPWFPSPRCRPSRGAFVHPCRASSPTPSGSRSAPSVTPERIGTSCGLSLPKRSATILPARSSRRASGGRTTCGCVSCEKRLTDRHRAPWATRSERSTGTAGPSIEATTAKAKCLGQRLHPDGRVGESRK